MRDPEGQEAATEEELHQTFSRFPKIEPLMSGVLKLDLDTTLEQVWTWAAFLSGGCVVAYLMLRYGRETTPLPFAVLPIALWALVVSVCLRFATDEYYVLDLDLQELRFRRKIFFVKWERPIVDLDQLAGVSVDGREHQTRRDRWWEYFIIFIRKDGTTIQVSDSERDLDARDDAALALAQLIGIRCWSGAFQRRLGIEVDPDTHEVIVHR